MFAVRLDRIESYSWKEEFLHFHRGRLLFVVSVTGVIRNDANIRRKVVLGRRESLVSLGWIGHAKQD